MVKVIDMDGNLQSWDWARQKYGNLEIIPTPGDGYKVVQLTECGSGWMGFTCTVLNDAGGAVSGQRVGYKHGDDVDIEITSGAGVAEHSAGPGEAYNPQTAQGPITWEVLDAASDQMKGIGWLMGSNHVHLQVTMRWNGGGGDEDGGDIAAAIDRLTAQLRTGIVVQFVAK